MNLDELERPKPAVLEWWVDGLSQNLEAGESYDAGDAPSGARLAKMKS